MDGLSATRLVTQDPALQGVPVIALAAFAMSRDGQKAAAASDGLTSLFNHACFKRFLELEVKRSQRQDHPTSLVLIDVDDFKSRNDTLGHAADSMLSLSKKEGKNRVSCHGSRGTMCRTTHAKPIV